MQQTTGSPTIELQPEPKVMESPISATGTEGVDTIKEEWTAENISNNEKIEV